MISAEQAREKCRKIPAIDWEHIEFLITEAAELGETRVVWEVNSPNARRIADAAAKMLQTPELNYDVRIDEHTVHDDQCFVIISWAKK